MMVNLKLSKDDKSEVVNELLYCQPIYLTNTRPYITFVVGMLSRFLNCPRETHWNGKKSDSIHQHNFTVKNCTGEK
jgi:hypothetical protein